MVIQKPITGQETPADRSPFAALVQFYRAFNGKDINLMQTNWSHSQETAMDNPLGGIKRGWEDIRQLYENIFNGQATVYVEFYDYSLHEYGDVFYAVGRERGSFQVANTQIKLAIRTSRIYRKEDGLWKQSHHHGSIENPELLKNYQNLVRK